MSLISRSPTAPPPGLAAPPPRLATVTLIILAAGASRRFASDRPKILHHLAGKPLIDHVCATAQALNARRCLLVAAPEYAKLHAAQPESPSAARDHRCIVQEKPEGTGAAVRQALATLPPAEAGEIVLILYGDCPLLRPESLRPLLAACTKADIAVGCFETPQPQGYGRLLRDPQGRILAIVEDAEANAQEKAITTVNAGPLAFHRHRLSPYLERLTAHSALKGEIPLTAVISAAVGAGHTCTAVAIPPDQAPGINTRRDLAAAELLMQKRLRAQLLASGVTLIDPESLWLCADSQVGRDCVLHPQVIFAPGVTLKERVTILPFCHLAGVTVESDTIIGPFARLRPESHLGAGSRVGSFVEIKNSHLGAGSKANHLSYLGDATIGAGSTIGAGVITCNYDGQNKHPTTIGDNVFVGAHTSLVAPLTLGDEAMIGAGSVITKDVPADGLAIARAPERICATPASARRKRQSSA